MRDGPRSVLLGTRAIRMKSSPNCVPAGEEASEAKMKAKMRYGGEKMAITRIYKYRGKIAKNSQKLARARKLLSVAEVLRAQGVDAQGWEEEEVDAEMEMDVGELRLLAEKPDKLELKRLKLTEKVAKYARKLAESELDLAEATVHYESLYGPRGGGGATGEGGHGRAPPRRPLQPSRSPIGEAEAGSGEKVR